jgi:hypothetical protein
LIISTEDKDLKMILEIIKNLISNNIKDVVASSIDNMMYNLFKFMIILDNDFDFLHLNGGDTDYY